MDDASALFAERIRAARRESPLCLRGGGSKDFYGGVPVGALLDTGAHTGIVAYEPTELVLTARAGTPLAEVEAALAAQGQFLAFEPPAFGGAATIGGVVAAGLSGPRRAALGAVRDFVLGVKLMDGEARTLDFGGRVMKNVAGYDVSRLVAGSLGTLGLILEVSLKVLPRPVADASLRFEMPVQKALEVVNAWAGQPLPVAATAWQDDVLTVRLAGARAAVAAARSRLGGEPLADDDGPRFWRALRDQRLPYFASAESLWRLSLPSVAPPLPLPGAQLIEWGGALRWLAGGAAAVVRAAAAQVGGHATLFRGGDKSQGVFQPAPAAPMRIQRQLKAAFDPRGVFNPGRLYPDF
jgi:glycolate oxidase FAD binding subunit